MPAGISNPGLGYATFCAIKFAGYTAAAHFLSMSYNRDDLASWKVGGVRTLIGMAAGAAYYGLWTLIPRMTHPTAGLFDGFPYLYLAGLLPVRIAEWWLLIWLFYDRALRQPPRAGAWWGSARYGLMFWMHRPLPASSRRRGSGFADSSLRTTD